MIKTELEFYCILKTAIEQRIGSKKNDFSSLNEISRATYYNIKNVCEGDLTSAKLSISKVEKVCKELNIDFEGIYYIIKDAKNNK